jgi:hypothetical protein
MALSSELRGYVETNDLANVVSMRDRDLPTFRELLKDQDEYGLTPFMCALECGSFWVANFILRKHRFVKDDEHILYGGAVSLAVALKHPITEIDALRAGGCNMNCLSPFSQNLPIVTCIQHSYGKVFFRLLQWGVVPPKCVLNINLTECRSSTYTPGVKCELHKYGDCIVVEMNMEEHVSPRKPGKCTSDTDLFFCDNIQILTHIAKNCQIYTYRSFNWCCCSIPFIRDFLIPLSMVSNVFLNDECVAHEKSGKLLSNKYLSYVHIVVDHTNIPLTLFEICRRRTASSILGPNLESAISKLPIPSSIKDRVLLKHVKHAKSCINKLLYP